MKKLFTAAILCSFLSGLTAQEVTIDGLSSDWSKDLLKLDKTTNLTTAVKNDAEYLYILFQADNQTSIGKMLQAGMEITFKAKVKPKVNAKFEFPLEAASGQATAQRQRTQGGQGVDRAAQLKERMNGMLATKNQAKLKGFSASNGQILLADLNGIQTGLAFDDSSEQPVLNYELRIPLSELYGASMDWDKITAKDLDINIKVNGVNAPSGGSVGAGGGRGGAGGGRGGAGGGRGGAGGGRGAGAASSSQGGTSMFTDQIVKLSYSIVK